MRKQNLTNILFHNVFISISLKMTHFTSFSKPPKKPPVSPKSSLWNLRHTRQHLSYKVTKVPDESITRWNTCWHWLTVVKGEAQARSHTSQVFSTSLSFHLCAVQSYHPFHLCTGPTHYCTLVSLAETVWKLWESSFGKKKVLYSPPV